MMIKKTLYSAGLVTAFLLALVSGVGADEKTCVALQNRLLLLERTLLHVSQTSELPTAERTAKLAKVQAEIASAKAALGAAGVAPADVEIGQSLQLVQTYGAGWVLSYLSQGKYTGRKEAFHKPLDGVTNMRGAVPGQAGDAAQPIMGPTLMIILSHDALCREAYREFTAEMDRIVLEMERRSGKAYDFWDKSRPAVIPNDLGWDVDRFWAFAQSCAGRAVDRYFWAHPASERATARNLVALLLVSALMNNVAIDLTGERDVQTKYAYWRSNAVPWLIPDKSIVTNKFKVWHFLTHAWITYLKMLSETRYDDGLLPVGRVRPTTNKTVRAAFRLSDGFGIIYEIASPLFRKKAGILEPTAVDELPNGLKKVCRFLHVKDVVGYESYKDIVDNRAGDRFGAALFLTKNPLTVTDRPGHAQLVEAWRAAH